MCEPQKSSSSCTIQEERQSTPETLLSGNDESFFKSLYEFIEYEKQYLQCPAEGPDELRFIIYRSVFNKVIGRATSYKKLLLTIKGEYDDTIKVLQRREEESKEAQRILKASTLHQKSLTTCQRRATNLKERLCVLQRETADLQQEIKKQQSLKEQSMWIPGMTVAESKDPEALDRYLERLKAQRDSLLDRKSHCVSVEVKAELEAKLQAAEQHRDQLRAENNRLKALFKRLRFVSNHVSCWERETQQVSLEQLLGSTVKNIKQNSMTEEDVSSIIVELFENEEPTGVDESKFLTDYLNRFLELFEAAEYEEAALHAARSPQGILRNLDIMGMFKGVHGPSSSAHPLLLFFQALLMTLPAGDKLSAALSTEMVRCALQHGDTQLINHSVTYNKLTSSEDLGDILTEHAQKDTRVADLCLALATVVYKTCRLDRKTALSICKRGLIHSVAEFMNNCKGLTAEDCMWVFYQSPSLSLLQLLTEPQQGQAAILSAGVVLSSLLSDPRQQELALRLLDSFVSRGQGVLEDLILEDMRSTLEDWTDVESMCSELNRADLSRAILSVLLNQSGTRALSPDLEGAQLVEHIFL
ncbi:LOW QUALITY PROTEIN: clathrin heavy chain linker domain-containing protein 1-like [Xyrichtys novacula]|uniref:LOW QUALITY PROTEIN: clathrin heavy chain linker domain-containing protein 1-like n=1 Tax=Xyrichtys novacula TaxID=13765 RepID=A0AAV1G0C2_XYRNO|nr:LOW QUALITY PROTEIN: clathrin heavy chain linker domain-containing protein 1-like [Xyrichtys novacula]